MPKPKRTPEERKKLRLAKKAEKKRLAELKKKQIKLDHLSREIKYGDLTIRRHEKKWKEMLLKITLPKMRQNLEYAWHNFERIIDSKDFQISLLMDEIKDAEEQYMIGIRNHIENIDKLIGAFRERLYELKWKHEDAVKKLTEGGQEEIDALKNSHLDNEQYFKMMLYGLEVSRKEFLKTVMGDYLSKLDEEDVKYTDIRLKMKLILDDKLQYVWDTTQKFLKDYDMQTAQRRNQYNTLNEQDIQMHKVMDIQRDRIFKSQDRIKNLKQQHNELVHYEGHRIEELLKERQYYADSFWSLKTKLHNEKKIDSENLTKLTLESNNVIDYLITIKKKGERILGKEQNTRLLPTNIYFSCVSS